MHLIFKHIYLKEHSRTPEIETAESQTHPGGNLSQFQNDCLLHINSSTAILNYFKLFESILGYVTTLTLRYLRPV